MQPMNDSKLLRVLIVSDSANKNFLQTQRLIVYVLMTPSLLRLVDIAKNYLHPRLHLHVQQKIKLTLILKNILTKLHPTYN